MLDPRLLRSFVAIADCGNFTHAARRLNMTQSTISQQLARLEQSVGHLLIDRLARPAMPTPEGQRLLGFARRILALQDEAEMLLAEPGNIGSLRIGVPEDLAAGVVMATFATFAERHGSARLDVTTGLSRELVGRYRKGEFDIIIAKEVAPAADCLATFPEPLGWFEPTGRDLLDRASLPLVTFPPGGLYRDAMFETLEALGRRWHIAFSGSSLASVLGAVEAGLGISLLPLGVASTKAIRRTTAFGQAAPLVVSLYTREKQGIVADLAAELREALRIRQASASPDAS